MTFESETGHETDPKIQKPRLLRGTRATTVSRENDKQLPWLDLAVELQRLVFANRLAITVVVAEKLFLLSLRVSWFRVSQGFGWFRV